MDAEHRPVVLYDDADPEHIAPPSEVCETCSNIEAGVLVPAPFCSHAKAKMGPAPWEGR